MRASSATEPAPIFCMTWALWNFTVRSAMPRSPAICLFNRPATTPSSTSRSRLDSRSSLVRTEVSTSLRSRADTPRANARRMAAIRSAGGAGFCEEIDRPGLHGLDAARDVAMRRQEHDGHVGSGACQGELQVEAGHARHLMSSGLLCRHEYVPWATMVLEWVER